MTRARRRVAWLADLEAVHRDPTLVPRLVDSIGLTTIIPESFVFHHSGFRMPKSRWNAGPFASWPERDGLAIHREIFGASPAALPVLPGVLGPCGGKELELVLDVCRRHGVEVWGHAGLWGYGAEVYPEMGVHLIDSQRVDPAEARWGSMFCPSNQVIERWIGNSLAHVADEYELDGWFLDHARYTTPLATGTWFSCTCPDCSNRARALGFDVGVLGEQIADARRVLASWSQSDFEEYAAATSAEAMGSLAQRWPAIPQWFGIRARILADSLLTIRERLLGVAAGTRFEFGTDVYPPGVALLGGHSYPDWGNVVSYFTGGFGTRIGWPSVTGDLADTVAAQARSRDEVDTRLERAVAAALVPRRPVGDAVGCYEREVAEMVERRGERPVYPPLYATTPVPELRAMGRAIVTAGADGVMLAGLETATSEQTDAIGAIFAPSTP